MINYIAMEGSTSFVLQEMGELGMWLSGRAPAWPVQDPGFDLQHWKKNIFSQVWWHTAVIPATREAAAGGLLEPRSSRTAWAM
jgi:hypothetical protein